jgi:glycosyltransferase involved in cell wall biosynthesis
MEKVVRILADLQTKAGFSVSVITSNQGVSSPVGSEDFHVSRLRSFVFASTIITPSLFFQLLTISRETVVHLHLTQAYMPELVWLASKIRGFKYIVHIHLDTPPSTFMGFLLVPYKLLILKYVLRSASYVVVFTKEQKQTFLGKYGLSENKVKVITNGVEDDFYYNKARKLHQKPRLLYVGRLGYQKNLSQLLRALDGISDQFELKLVGDGEQYQELTILAKTLKLQSINFIGRITGRRILDYYKEADIFVLPSEREGMPLVLLEAMAMGLPIIATDVVGNREIVKNNKNGLLVKLNDTHAFQAALLRLSGDKDLFARMCNVSRELALQYSWNKINTKFEELYNDMENYD